MEAMDDDEDIEYQSAKVAVGSAGLIGSSILLLRNHFKSQNYYFNLCVVK